VILQNKRMVKTPPAARLFERKQIVQFNPFNLGKKRGKVSLLNSKII